MALSTTTIQTRAYFSLKNFMQRHQLVAYFVLAYAILALANKPSGQAQSLEVPL